MNSRTYINPRVDRSRWPSGPWDDEPDKVSWTDEATGLPCIAVRHPRGGNWCGYVAVEPGHPFHGKGHEAPPVAVHGRLTYAAACREDEPVERAVCHIPEPDKPTDVWWFGFDCGHSHDFKPGMLAVDPAPFDWGLERLPEAVRPRYRSLDYVQRECELLAAQLKELG